MQLLHRLEDFESHKQAVVLTIGNFDGVHRGHLAVLQCARSIAGKKTPLVALTFSNHPSEVLRPFQPTQLLCTLAHKIQLLQACHLHALILLPFTLYLAQHSAASFIERIRQFIPFSHLVLGHDATLGRDRQGDKALMQDLAMQWGFEVHYIEEYRYEAQPVSSTRIRALVQQGNLELVETLLGRPYSIYSTVIFGSGRGKQLGFPTANLAVQGLTLPPFGVYAVEVKKGEELFQGIANLGLAPTVKQETSPLLEVHLFDFDRDLYQQKIEVVFKDYLRPEKKFDSLNALHKQIELDIRRVKNL